MFSRKVFSPIANSKVHQNKNLNKRPLNFATLEKATTSAYQKNSSYNEPKAEDNRLIKTQLLRVEALGNLDDCISMAAEATSLHKSTKQLLLSKISTMPEFKKYK